MGMNSEGKRRPSSGCRQRSNASAADNGAGIRVDNGLIVHLELVSVERAAQVVLQRQPLERGCGHGLGVGLVAVAPLLLRLVHGGIGVHQQGIEVLAIEGIDGDADAGVDEDLMGADPNRMRETADDAPGELRGVLGVVQPRHDDGELVATETRHFRSQGGEAGPTSSSRSRQQERSRDADMPQELIAHLMAEGVIDPAEVVEVDEERGHQLLISAGLFQRVGQALLVRQAVRQPGEAVVVGQLPHLIQHARVGQRHRRLVGQPAHLHPIFLAGHEIESLAQGDDAGQLPLVGQREYDERRRT